MNTVSLRRRVTITALLVLLIVLPVTGLAVKAIFDAQAERNLSTLLTGRAQLAQQLARQNVAPNNLVRRIDADGVRVTLVLRTGQQFGAPALEPTGELRQVRTTLAAGQRTRGATLLLSADTSLLDGASRTLQRVLFIAGAAALLITGVALVLGMRLALAPLDTMTSLARSIAAGRRGGRLQPTRRDTELGRTAAAFDEMLDSLEGAERTARGAEQHLRQFVADAAHELRTPVTGLQTAAETLLQLGPDAPAERRDELELLLVRESRRAGSLVADLLELARIDAGLVLRREPVLLKHLARTQAGRLRLLAPGLTIEIIGADVQLDADRDRLTQILANLLDNARHATGDSGRIDVLIGSSAGQVQVVVQDDGPGVPVEDRERIFQRLVHGERSRGSGLGLPIARGFARAHGGDLIATDRPDGKPGAAFLLTLKP
ncbi:HAMP domain-containing sensor histidine kinase [Kribbella sp. CA-293567]|uniref:HAMP domain-containing sensor histidine kinase n=1 Tax=Kribbella sp. CA-293567 TaxID=3002436 RepID=UPI0022DE59AA|nr:HAMP domain-containing sensor histidine kinase [Kribbella sp. CA-293567]WBQ06002.1 HAMP domain-containing sensor histidine kinase [Kribbella sp. CA-293567]